MAVTAGSFCRSAPAAELRGFDEQAVPGLGLARVHRFELGHGHVDLAADLEHGGVGAARRGQFLGHVGHRGHVGRHVLPGHAITTGGRLHEAPVLVDKRHGHPVHLGLTREGQRTQVQLGIDPPQPLTPGPELVLVEGVVQAHHGHSVAHLREETRGGGADRLRGRVRRGQIRVALLETPQLDDEAVILGIGDPRGIEDVVQLVVVDDEPSQLVDAGSDVRGNIRGHRQAAMPAPTTASGSRTS